MVHEPDEVAAAFESAMHEAEVAFGNGDCFVERFLARPRHVEVKVLGDQFGTVLAVGTRDCSLQRRNQKLIEEAPAPFLAAETVRELERAAVAICSRAHYESAGTVGFLVDDGTMSFMEVNTRIQVEHPVTEAVTGVDLVAAQLAIAEGAPVEAVPGLESGVTPEPRGHAMEFRINAEDPSLGFVPFPGVVESLQVPTGPGIRFDSGVAAGDSISSRYDSMIAKLIVKASTRAECLRRAERALAELHIHGVPTVVPFDKGGARISGFRRGCRLEGPTTMCPMRISACTRAGSRRNCCRICPRKRLRTGVAPASGRWANAGGPGNPGGGFRPARRTARRPLPSRAHIGRQHRGGRHAGHGGTRRHRGALARRRRRPGARRRPDRRARGDEDGTRSACAGTGTLHITVPVGEQADYGAVLGTID